MTVDSSRGDITRRNGAGSCPGRPSRAIHGIAMGIGLSLALTAATPGQVFGAEPLSDAQRERVAEELGITPEQLERLRRGELSGEEALELQRLMGEGLHESLQDPATRRLLQENLPEGAAEQIIERYRRNPAVLDPCLVGRWRLDNGAASTDEIEYSGVFELDINPSGRVRARYRAFEQEIITSSVYDGDKSGLMCGQSPDHVLIEWNDESIEEASEHVVTGEITREQVDGGPLMPVGDKIYRCTGDAIRLTGIRFVGAGQASCEELVARARARFGIPPPGESGHDVQDGWWLDPARRGNPRAQRAGLVRGRSVLAEDVGRYLQDHPDARQHIEDTLDAFERELGIERLDPDGDGRHYGADLDAGNLPVDVDLVLAKGARESGIEDLLSRSDRVIVSSGREVHPEGESGLDYLYDHRDDFPPSMRDELRPVPRAELTERGRARASPPAPARLPLRLLLAAFIVETRRAEQGFIGKVRDELDAYSVAELRAALNAMSVDARRAWSQLHFGLPGAVREVLAAIAETTPEGELPDLDRLINDPTFTRGDFSTRVVRFGIRRSLVTAAEAWLIDNYGDQCRLSAGC